MRDIETQAKALIVRAQQQADQLLAAAQAEGVKIRQRAYDEGFTAGKQDGTRKGTEDGKLAGKQAALAEHRVKLEQLARALTAAIADIDSSRSRLESTAGTDVLRLAVAIARRATKLRGAADPSVLTNNISESMKLVVHASDVRISVHPTEKQTLHEVLPQLRLAWPNVTHLELVEDATLSPGGCRIATAQGQVDADLDNQINRIAADLLPSNAGEAAANAASTGPSA